MKSCLFGKHAGEEDQTDDPSVAERMKEQDQRTPTNTKNRRPLLFSTATYFATIQLENDSIRRKSRGPFVTAVFCTKTPGTKFEKRVHINIYIYVHLFK